MAKQTLNSQQSLIKALSTEYPTFQIKTGTTLINLTAGDVDYAVTLSTKFPNGVLWGQASPGGPQLNWNYLLRGQQAPYHSGTDLKIDLHYYSAVNQQCLINWTVFGY